jgi:hypothetical protein
VDLQYAGIHLSLPDFLGLTYGEIEAVVQRVELLNKREQAEYEKVKNKR